MPWRVMHWSMSIDWGRWGLTWQPQRCLAQNEVGDIHIIIFLRRLRIVCFRSACKRKRIRKRRSASNPMSFIMATVCLFFFPSLGRSGAIAIAGERLDQP